MKVIVSHDVDHLSTSEHLLKDFYILKSLVRNTAYLVTNRINLSEYLQRLREFATNKLNYIEELSNFNKANGVNATFFFATANGLSLSYKKSQIKNWIEYLLNSDYFSVGIHGISFNDFSLMKKEKDDFEEITGIHNFGIRMHYLRGDNRTLEMLSRLDYLFDSTFYSIKQPYQIGNMWVFPLTMMDVYQISGKKKYTNNEIKKLIINQLEEVENANLSHISINFHDRYFSTGHRNYYRWYKYLIEILKSRGHSFVNYNEAIADLNRKNEENRKHNQ